MRSQFRQARWILLLLALGLGASGLASWLGEHWQMPRVLPLDTVRFDGELARVRESRLREALRGRLDGGFLGVEVAAVRRGVESLPWVATASVRRIWPDALQVTVREQKPVARWGGVALMNTAGQVFQPRTLPEQPLPALAGPPGSASRVLARFREFEALLSPLGLQPSGLTLDERRAWTLELAGGGLIRLGREAVTERLKRFVAAWPALSDAQQKRLARADLRYPNGFALRWQDEDAVDDT
ncbi:cell division protein FtsQ/DivIB [Spiribacter pallidus]|uniref:Cell division protein FtsQ n=1 Tax=Spiribacter pallidus TaxID=1987936 RepID=A0ABV3TA70_9GAMM